MASIDELLAGVPIYTRAQFELDRERLEHGFLMLHRLQADAIDRAIIDGTLSCCNPLVEEWIAIHDMEPYLEIP